MRFSLPLFDDPAPVTARGGAGGPLNIPVSDIDEDPGQPRVEFDDEPLKELAATIAERGVRSPVSVRSHPEDRGRWMLNYGARRLRAAKLAGLHEIPAFVDEAADSYDQVIENEQREGLKPLELALFVQRELGKGASQAEIARRLGKSQTYITFVRAMIDPPAWLMDVYRSGRCRNAARLYELRRLHEADPERVEKGLDGLSRIGGGHIDQLKKDGEVSESQAAAKASDAGGGPSAIERPARRERLPSCAANSRDSLVLTATYEGKRVRVQLDALPPRTSAVYVADGSTAEQEVADVGALSDLELARRTA